MTTQLSPTPIFKAFANDGLPLAYGKLYSFAAGTTTPQATYVDSTQTTQNTNPIILNARGECALWLAPGLSYKLNLTDLFGNQIAGYPVDNITVGATLPIDSLNVHYDITSAEIAAGVTPTNYAYEPGRLERYGGDPLGIADSSIALQSALSVSSQTSGAIAVVIQAGTSFRILTGSTITGQFTLLGQGKNSKLLCDGAVGTFTSSNNAVIDNLWMENITAPWIITRNPANWAQNISGTLQQSNTVLGYQPTVNDTDIWAALTGAQQSQNIGPIFQFTGAASFIEVSRIYGRFVRISIRDATDSQVHDCDFRGGKGTWGSIEFDNMTNGVQRGMRNRAFDNRVQYSSFGSIIFMSNDEFSNCNNIICRGGESGTKTMQTTGVQFTASIGGATSGTLTGSITNGSYTFVFSDAEVRTVTITGGTAASWSAALAATTILTASIYQTALNPQCFNGLVEGNHCFENYYDGLDCDSTFPGTNDSAQTSHLIIGNRSYNNGHDGMNGDGQFNAYKGNYIAQNGAYGLWGLMSYSTIEANTCINNNTARNALIHDISVAGITGLCKVGGNYVYAGAGQNNYGIYAPGTHFIGENYGANGAIFFFGNPSAIPSVVQNYADGFTGLLTDQAFTITIANNAGTLQHSIVSDYGSSALGNLSSRVIGASASFTNTPTGTDSTTAFAAGVKVGSGTNYFLWFDVAPQVGVMADIVATVATNSTGAALCAMCQFSSININSVTQNRLAIGLTTNAGAGFAINTTNITAGNGIRIQFKGKLS